MEGGETLAHNTFHLGGLANRLPALPPAPLASLLRQASGKPSEGTPTLAQMRPLPRTNRAPWRIPSPSTRLWGTYRVLPRTLRATQAEDERDWERAQHAQTLIENEPNGTGRLGMDIPRNRLIVSYLLGKFYRRVHERGAFRHTHWSNACSR